MRPLVFVFLFALVCACHANVRVISCHDLCQSFNYFVSSATDNAHDCSKTGCTSSRISFVRDRLQQLHPDLILVDADVRLNLNRTDAVHDKARDALADLLVLSILGRAVTKQSDMTDVGKNIVYYQYDENENGIRPVYGNCNFQKTMYVTLLIITIGILVVILAFQQQPESDPPPQRQDSQTTPASTTQGLHFSLSQANSMRYRVGPQH